MTADAALPDATPPQIAGGELSSGLRQYVSFAAGSEQYAVDIMSVREIKGWSDVTSLPNQPAFVRGVLNLRGAVLPIVDLQCRLGGGHTQTSQRHVIVIVAIEDRMVGLLVDAVSDILTVPDENIRPVPETSSREDQRVFSGFLTEDEQMVAMLDLSQLLNAELFDETDSADGVIQ